MGQERVFKVKIDGENFYTGRDLTSGQVYGSPLVPAGLLMTFDAAAAIVARLDAVGYPGATVTDVSGREIGPNNDRPSSAPQGEVNDLWGPVRTAQPAAKE